MVNCKRTEKAGAYLDGAMSPTERAEFDAHLVACPECSAEVSRLTRLSRFIASAEAPQPTNLVSEFRRRRNVQKRLVRIAAVMTGAAAAVILATTLSMIFGSHDLTPPSMSWQQAAVGQQLDSQTQTDVDDPLAQMVLQEKP
jgi:anti-sigma factor RsiW